MSISRDVPSLRDLEYESRDMLKVWSEPHTCEPEPAAPLSASAFFAPAVAGLAASLAASLHVAVFM